MTNLKPAEKVQMSIIDLTIDLLDKAKCDSIPTLIGLTEQYLAAMFMKRPEFMYKVFSELNSLNATEIWLDEELDQLEALYNG